jgi:hypothetical protein
MSRKNTGEHYGNLETIKSRSNNDLNSTRQEASVF